MEIRKDKVKAFSCYMKFLTITSLFHWIGMVIARLYFQFLCSRIGIRTTKKQFQYLWDAKNLSLWFKTSGHLAFFPKRGIRRCIRILEKRTNQQIHSAAIGPGIELLLWFKDLHIDSESNNKRIHLTKKQVGFVYALSDKLGTYSPQTIFQMLNSYQLVDAWFTLSKILADYPFERLKISFETLSKKVDFPIGQSNLLNGETLRAWLEKTLTCWE